MSAGLAQLLFLYLKGFKPFGEGIYLDGEQE